MADQQKSFDDLVKEAPELPAAGTVSLVGTLARSNEAGKFVLTLQNGSTLTLETSAVKGHTVLGTSVGETIVRVDVDAKKLQSNPNPSPWFRPAAFFHTNFGADHKNSWEEPVHPTGVTDHFGGYGALNPGGVSPFALATSQQVPQGLWAALQSYNPFVLSGWPDVLSGFADQPLTGIDDILPTGRSDFAGGNTGGPGRFAD